jgi:hypothetical protein
MGTKNGNVKGIDLLSAPRGLNNGAVFLITFDLLNTATTGGTDTIQLGGAGDDQEVASTQTLAQMIAARVRDGGTCTLDWVGQGNFPGYQAGAALYTTGATLSTDNITGIALQNAASGGSAVSTTSAGWDAAGSVVVGCHFSTAQ